MLWPLLGILLTATTVQAQAISDQGRFELFNFCRPMMLVVEDLPPAAQAAALTRERIQLAAESRLRAARLYTESREKANRAYLYVRIHVLGRGHNITVEYKKWVTDLATNSNGHATTWNTGIAGTHGGEAALGSDFIIQGLSSLLDKFLAGYLRVNEPACDRR